MKRSSISCIPVLILAAGLATAHDGDPKALDRLPPINGAAFRQVEPVGAPEFPAQNVVLMSWFPLASLNAGATSGNDCWGYTSASGREYALVGVSNGSAYVEVTNPGNSQLVGFIEGPTSLWRDIKVYKDYAYVVSEGGSGIQVVDLSQIDNGVVTLVNVVTTGGNQATHNVAINEESGYLYRCGGGSNGVRIYNLNPDPANPQYVGAWSTRYVHDTQVVSYTSGPWAGREIAFCCTGYNGGIDETGLDILDVTNKQNIVSLARRFWPQPGYSHQGWLSPDRTYFYVGDELDEQEYGIGTTTHVFNVADLLNPVYVGAFTNDVPATGHNMYTRGNLIFQANYRSGMRVFDATDPVNPVETAYFDTFPSSNSNNFNGLWSVYPYFPSGTVIGSDLERGLFVWHVGDPLLAFSFPNGVPSLLNPAGQSVLVQIDESEPGQLQPGSAQLIFDAGGGPVAVELVSLGGNLFRADFPPIACPSQVAFYFAASAANGSTWRAPTTAPAEGFRALAAHGTTTVFEDDMQTDKGWTVGAPGDNATAGIWNRMDPEQTTTNGLVVQPGDDHTPSPGTICWVTDGFAGQGAGDRDVDGGTTTLNSPTLDLSDAPNAVISYWRWYTNDKGSNPSSDTFVVQISNNNGANWTNVEVVGPGGPQASGGWYYYSFRVADILPPTATVRLRFRASDLGGGSLVEALVDDFLVENSECAPECSGDVDGDGAVCQGDLGILLGVYGLCEGDPGWNPAANCDPTPDGNGDQCINQGDLGVLLSQFGACGAPCP